MFSTKPFYFISLIVIFQSISQHVLCDDSSDDDDGDQSSAAALIALLLELIFALSQTTTAAPIVPAPAPGTPTTTTAATTAVTTAVTNAVPCTICPCWNAQTDFTQCTVALALGEQCGYGVSQDHVKLQCGNAKELVAFVIFEDPEPNCYFKAPDFSINTAAILADGKISEDAAECCAAILDSVYDALPATCIGPDTLVADPTETECPCDFVEDPFEECVSGGSCTLAGEGGTEVILSCDNENGGISLFTASAAVCSSNGDTSSIETAADFDACATALYGFSLLGGCTSQ